MLWSLSVLFAFHNYYNMPKENCNEELILSRYQKYILNQNRLRLLTDDEESYKAKCERYLNDYVPDRKATPATSSKGCTYCVTSKLPQCSTPKKKEESSNKRTNKQNVGNNKDSVQKEDDLKTKKLKEVLFSGCIEQSEISKFFRNKCDCKNKVKAIDNEGNSLNNEETQNATVYTQNTSLALSDIDNLQTTNEPSVKQKLSFLDDWDTSSSSVNLETESKSFPRNGQFTNLKAGNNWHDFELLSSNGTLFSESDDEREFELLLDDFKNDVDIDERKDRLHTFLNKWGPPDENDLTQIIDRAKLKSLPIGLVLEDMLNKLSEVSTSSEKRILEISSCLDNFCRGDKSKSKNNNSNRLDESKAINSGKKKLVTSTHKRNKLKETKPESNNRTIKALKKNYNNKTKVESGNVRRRSLRVSSQEKQKKKETYPDMYYVPQSDSEYRWLKKMLCCTDIVTYEEIGKSKKRKKNCESKKENVEIGKSKKRKKNCKSKKENVSATNNTPCFGDHFSHAKPRCLTVPKDNSQTKSNSKISTLNENISTDILINNNHSSKRSKKRKLFNLNTWHDSKECEEEFQKNYLSK